MSRAWYKHALFLITALLFFSAFTTYAQIHFVSKSGSNTPPYISWNTAAHKIQDAINASNRGDTVLVGVGDYFDSIRVDKRLTIIGERLEETIVRGDSVFGYKTFILSDTCKIEGLTIITRADSMYGQESYGVNAVGPTTINNCIIKNAQNAIAIYGFGFEISNVVIQNVITGLKCIWQSPSEVGRLTNANITVRQLNSVPQWAAQAAVWVDYGKFYIDGLTAVNTIPRTGATAIFNNSFVAGGGGKNVSVRNFFSYGITYSSKPGNNYYLENSVIEGTRYGVEIYGYSSSIYNTILINNETGLVATSEYIGDYNLYYNNLRNRNGSSAYQGEHDLFTDPMFINSSSPPTTEFDYHLQYGSPAIDAGAPWLLDADGSRSDIGVFGGPGGSSYPYQDLPPLAPKWISSKVENKKVTLKWKKNGESDYLKSYLHRSTVQGYTPDSTTIIAVLDGSTLQDTAIYTDTLPSYAIPYYYKLQSEDSTGHLGNPGNAMAVTAVSIRENSTTELFDYRLEQNYPNPFNATTMIPFSLKEEGSVTISLYTTTGEKVATLASSHYAKGSYEVSADLGHLASGIYLYRIEVHNGNRLPVFRDMKKLVMVK